jgi:23S rRNA pseudouridine2605 synthase
MPGPRPNKNRFERGGQRPKQGDRPSGGRPQAKPTGENALGVRLQKALADAGVASRRECEAMIADGRVEVNGEVRSTLPVFIQPGSDRVTVDGRLVPLRGGKRTAKGPQGHGAPERVYVMLNKPDRTLCTTRDAQTREEGGRKTVVDLVKHPSGVRLYPVGRMDYDATGLVILTNDGALAERLTHARYGIGRVQRVVVAGRPSPDALETIKRRVAKRDAVDVNGHPTQGIEIIKAADEPDAVVRGPRTENTTLDITLREGKTDPLEDVLYQAKLDVKRSQRIGIGPLRMTGLKIGEWRNLTKDELALLREATGLEAGARREVRPTLADHPSASQAKSTPVSRPHAKGRDRDRDQWPDRRGGRGEQRPQLGRVGTDRPRKDARPRPDQQQPRPERRAEPAPRRPRRLDASDEFKAGRSGDGGSHS